MNEKRRILRGSSENVKSLPSRNPDRRAYQRYQVNKIVSFAHRQKRFLTLAVDLGMGGMKIKTHEKFRRNERLDFKMVLGKDSISLGGRVVYNKTRSDGQRVSGIQFLGLSSRDSDILSAYLSDWEE